MTIQSERITNSSLVLYLSGRLDTATAPQLERKIKQFIDTVADLILDFTDLSYISSMGLRVLLQAQKTIKAQNGKLIIRNMSPEVREVFEMTGFIKLMVQDEKFIVIKKAEGGAITFSLIGQMEPENVPALAKELLDIRDANMARAQPVTLILDAARLDSLPAACHKPLKEAIDSSAWENRTIVIQNAAEDIQSAVEAAGMGSLLEQSA
jgi:anti-sigma B factor antagonist